MFQLRRMSPTSRFDPGLRRPRQGNPLSRLLRQALRAQGLRLRPHPHPRVHRRRRPDHPQRRQAQLGRQGAPRPGLPQVRLLRLRRGADDQQERALAQEVLQLRRLRPLAGLHELERRPERRDLLQGLLRKELRAARRRLRHGRRRAHHGVGPGSAIKILSYFLINMQFRIFEIR